MNVSRWMTRTPIACRPEHSLARAAQLLWEHDLGALPVVDAEQKLVGMITDRDLCMASFTRGSGLGEHTVESAMARQVFTLDAKASIKKAHELFRKHQLRRLPVVDAKAGLVGMLTVQDVARKTFDALGKSKRKAAAFEVARTLATIAAPRAPAKNVVTKTVATKAAKPAGNQVLAPTLSTKKAPAKVVAPRATKRPARRPLAKSRA
ncbi:MAG: CBS domain-containing protein [Planctomycetes bacterium]|nr:CBS domain-containing protein [Planctomycetota bacterium]